MTWLPNIDNTLPVLITAIILLEFQNVASFEQISLLHVKWFIHSQKKDNHDINFNNFLLCFENVFKTQLFVKTNYHCLKAT